MRKKFSSFGGVMLWDASQSYANGRFHATVKSALSAAGGTGFTYPACSAPAYASGSSYSAGQQVGFPEWTRIICMLSDDWIQVTYAGYIWQAKWYASDVPNPSFTGDWQVISACGGAAVPPSSSTTTSTTTTKTTTTSSSTPSSGSCSGVAAWSSSVAYTGGSKVSGVFLGSIPVTHSKSLGHLWWTCLAGCLVDSSRHSR
jgi:chitinase